MNISASPTTRSPPVTPAASASSKSDNSVPRFRIFKGIESDILADGSLDYPDEILREFDFIVASIHGQFKMDRELQTERLLRAAAIRSCPFSGT
jgi:histidinol phosphatase-like PHP family hydrolase